MRLLVYAVRNVCCTRCMLYIVYAVLGVNSESWQGEIDRDVLSSCSYVMVKLRTRMIEMWRYGGNHRAKLGLKRILCPSQLTIPIQQVRVPIRHLITSIQGFPNPIRQVVPVISHIRAYPPHRSHLHPSSLCFSSTTLLSSQNTMRSHPSLSLNVMIMSWHQVQHTPSTAYTDNSIHQIHHTPMIDCLPFILMITRWPLNVASSSCVPPYTIDQQQPAHHQSIKVKSLYAGCELTNW